MDVNNLKEDYEKFRKDVSDLNYSMNDFCNRFRKDMKDLNYSMNDFFNRFRKDVSDFNYAMNDFCNRFRSICSEIGFFANEMRKFYIDQCRMKKICPICGEDLKKEIFREEKFNGEYMEDTLLFCKKCDDSYDPDDDDDWILSDEELGIDLRKEDNAK